MPDQTIQAHVEMTARKLHTLVLRPTQLLINFWKGIVANNTTRGLFCRGGLNIGQQLLGGGKRFPQLRDFHGGPLDFLLEVVTLCLMAQRRLLRGSKLGRCFVDPTRQIFSLLETLCLDLLNLFFF